MARCTVCRHPSRDEIDQLLINPQLTVTEVANKFSVPLATLYRHQQNHLAVALAIGEGTVDNRQKLVNRLEWWEDRLCQIAKTMLPISPEEAAELGILSPRKDDQGNRLPLTLQELAAHNLKNMNPLGLAGIAKSAGFLLELRARVELLICSNTAGGQSTPTSSNVNIILPNQLPAGSPGQSLGRQLGTGMNSTIDEGSSTNTIGKNRNTGPSAGFPAVINVTAAAE